MDFLPVESIQERDTDLLILEELIVNQAFCAWFTDKLSLPGFTSKNQALKSISDFGMGETDLLFSYQSDQKNIFVLIENKLDADFQENQYERYLERANKYIAVGKCDLAFVLLLAPHKYLEDQSQFETTISYEAIKTFFEEENTQRSRFKTYLLEIAIEKQRRSYRPINSPVVQQFWLAYYHTLHQNHPNLKMKKPGVVPWGSDWIRIYSPELPGIELVHKLSKGFIDAVLKNEVDLEKLRAITPQWLKLINLGSLWALRVVCSQLDRLKPFRDQVKSVNSGIQKAEEICQWLVENKGVLL